MSDPFSGRWVEAFRPDLDRWFRDGPQGEAIKDTAARGIWRWEGTVVKQFRSDRWPDRSPAFAYRSKALPEFENLRTLEEKGIAVPKPLAAVRDGAHAYLFTRELPGAEPLSERIEELDPKRLGRFVAEVLGTGLVHRDLHLGNILTAEGSYTLIDLHRAHFEPPSRYRCVESLGFLLMSMSEPLRLTERLRFLHAFADHDRVCDARANWNEFVAEVEGAFLRIRHAYFVDRVRRVFTDSVMTVHTELAETRILSARGSAVPDLEEARGGTLVKESGRRAVYRTESGMAVKIYRRGFLRTIAEDMFDTGPAAREWRHSFALKIRRVPVPEPIALISTAGAEAFVARWVEGAEPLPQHAAAHGLSKELLVHLAREVRRMHDRGAVHRDLKAANVLVRDGRPVFVDLGRVTLELRASLSDRLMNLAQLNAALGAPVTRADRLRFYRAYAGRDFEWHQRWKGRIAEIMRRTVERNHVWP